MIEFELNTVYMSDKFLNYFLEHQKVPLFFSA